MPELEKIGEMKRKKYVPYNATVVSDDKLGITSAAYMEKIESNKSKKEEYETQNNESNDRLVDYNLLVTAISKYTKDGLDNILSELNVGDDSDVRGLIEDTWNNVSAGLEKAKDQQSEIDKITADREQLIASGESDGAEEQQKINDVIESRKKTLLEVENTKQRPQEDVDKLTEEINDADANIVVLQTIIDDATKKSEKLESDNLKNMEARMYYDNLLQPHNDFLSEVKKSLDEDESGLFDAATARIKSAQYIYGKKLKARIEKACDAGQYGFVADDLTTIECHLLNTLGYSVEEIPGGRDIVKVIRKKYTTNYITKADDTPDFHVTWNQVVGGPILPDWNPLDDVI